MSNAPSGGGKGLTAVGKIFSVLLVLGLIGLGAYIVVSKRLLPSGKGGGPGTPANPTAKVNFDTSELTDTEYKQPKIDPPGDYVPQNGTLDIELSEYAGYAGLIAANGGLDPSDNSYFATKHGFKVRIRLNESEDWGALNSGKLAASATTADVLAIYGRPLHVIVPAQISYSRGADGILVRKDIRKLNDLTGKTVSLCQFTESDFLLRYLAHEANIPVKMLPDLGAAPDPDSINMVFCKDGLPAGALFEKAAKANSPALAGAVTWAPAINDIPAKNPDTVKLLVSNRNLLLVADVLIVNKGFADKNPKMVAGLVDGLLHGNQMVRDNPQANWEVVGKAFKWSREQTLAELEKVHLSNLPEQTAFFTAGIAQGGSFASIFQSARDMYSIDFKELKDNLIDSDYFLRLDALKEADASGDYKSQTAAIRPLESKAAVSERDPVLSKDIHFEFLPNSSELDMKNQYNLNNLDALKRILDISPGSYFQLVGHADPVSTAADRKKLAPDALAATNARATQLSKERAVEILNQLVKRNGVDKSRFETVGMGYDKPLTLKPEEADRNRRVEVQWFTLE